MSKLINADTFRHTIMCQPKNMSGNYVLELISKAPAADAVEVVRCKDCKFWHEVDTMNVLRYGECDRISSAIRQDCFVNENWFCADGERKAE